MTQITLPRPAMSPVLVTSIPSPPERHDEFLRTRVAPVVHALQSDSPLRAVWFERANKPDWSLHVVAAGDRDWLEAWARPVLSEELGVATGEARFVEEAPYDKWTGGGRFTASLSGFHHPDSLACLEALICDADARLGSRAQFNMRVVECLLDALEVFGEARMSFYRESFEWAVELGRWDGDVLDSLERTYAGQRDALAAAIGPDDDAAGTGRWPSADAARIGRTLGERIAAWAAVSAGASEPIAIHAARSHSNRLGIHGGREAALRYLVWRARGGHPFRPA